MTMNEEIQQVDDLPEDPWEERTLYLLHHTMIDRDLARAEARKWRRKKHKLRWLKEPMAIPELILKLQDENLRESSLRLLSTFLLEKREVDPENYYRTAFLLYYSCSTMAILIQEVVAFFRMMVDGNLNKRSSKRLANVLTLFQCIAANTETRHKFVKCLMPNILVPLILFGSPMEVLENIRSVALSVFGILCQDREPSIIHWAVENNLVQVCHIGIETGNELSKVIAMYILEAIMQDDLGISYICSPLHKLLEGFMRTFGRLVTLLCVELDSPRLLFHIIRCYVLLCSNVRGHSIIRETLPDPILNGSFNDITEEFPVIGNLVQLLLLTVAKNDCYTPRSLGMIPKSGPQDLLLGA